MSEANILNTTSTSQLNPDYGYSEGLPELHDELVMDSGEVWTREARRFGRIYQLTWARRAKATMHSLIQWEQQYRRDFFTFKDFERGRDFSGRLILEPGQRYVIEGNEQFTIRGRFVELVGKAMNTYPSDWTRDANFLEERDGSGAAQFAFTGTWSYEVSGFAHGGAHYNINGTVVGDKARLHYFGYGCRVWSLKAAAYGKVDITVRRLRDGAVVAGTTRVDLYNATTLASAVVFTAQSLPLERYEVELAATNDKNASASNFFISADAIEVMR